MTESNFTNTRNIAAPEWLRSLHFIGIGGAGMSGIALVLRKRGYDVTGSDLKSSRYVTLLEKAGVSGEDRSQRPQSGPSGRGGHLVGHPVA